MRNRGNIFVFVPAAIAVWFIYGFVLPYLGGDPGRFGIFASRRDWLTMHILAGCAAILLGPVQFWLGFDQRPKMLHRILGVGYVIAVAMSGTAAFYLAYHTDFGWVFGLGLTTMSCAWILTTGLATVAIIRGMVEQHREWMIRSYVVTFGFVTLRVLTTLLEMFRVGTLVERMTVASWIAWSAPLVATEVFLQGRKVFARRISAALPRGANAYSTLPEPAAFDLPGSESSYLHRP